MACAGSHMMLLCLMAVGTAVVGAEDSLEEICEGLHADCNCYQKSNGRNVVDCSNKKLAVIPKFINLVGHSIHSVLLNDNKISRLPPNAFKNLNVKVINMNNNPLSSVSDSAFYHIMGLEELHLRNCSLNMAPRSLEKVPELEKVDLSMNDISALTDTAFKSLVKLKWLDLSHNKRIQFPDPFTAFENLTNLEHLDLSYCNLHNLPLGTSVKHVAKLKAVLLRNNSIGNIMGDVLNKSPNLEILDLENNPVRLSNQEVFHGLRKLRALKLGTCSIPEISKSMFRDQHKLETLTFHHCDIRKIEAGFFSDFTLLKVLDIGGNPSIKFTQDLISGLEYKLTTLGISDMNIEQFPTDTLAMFYELRVLNASGNHITKLAEGAFRGFHQLETEIYLNGNRINDISDQVAKGVHLPFTLDLRNNKLTSLDFLSRNPCGFARSRVEVSGNPIHCDCEIYRLVQKKNIDIVGTCHGPTQYRGIMLAPPFQEAPSLRYYEQFVEPICRKTDEPKFEQRYDCGCLKWKDILSVPCELPNCSAISSISVLAVVAVVILQNLWN